MRLSKWVVVALSSLAIVGIAGIGYAAGRATAPKADDGSAILSAMTSMMGANGMMGANALDVSAMDAMHNSPAMQQMHDGLSPELRAACDEMHAQMASMMSGGIMGGGMPTDGPMASHHPDQGAS